jgi:hypothetical protein
MLIYGGPFDQTEFALERFPRRGDLYRKSCITNNIRRRDYFSKVELLKT